MNNTQLSEYKILHEIGRGDFCSTYKGIRYCDNKFVSIKCIDIFEAQKYGLDIESITKEVNILKSLNNSEFFVKYYGSFIGDKIDNNIVKKIYFIVTEFIEGLTLNQYIDKINSTEIIDVYNPPSWHLHNPIKLWNIILQLILGLKYLHNNGYAHRDIKLENIIITDNGIIKYIDVGLSCFLKCKIDKCRSDMGDTIQNLYGNTPFYIPIEIWAKNNDPSYNAKYWDIWALSLVILMLCNQTTCLSFHDSKSDKDIINYIVNNHIDHPNYQYDYDRTNNFISKILVSDWKTRPNINEIFHYYLTELYI